VEDEPAVVTPSLRSSVVVEASVPVVEGTTVAEPAVVEEPVVVEAPAVVETQVGPAVEEQVVESAVAEAIKVTTEATPLDPVQEEESTDEGEVSVLLGKLELFRFVTMLLYLNICCCSRAVNLILSGVLMAIPTSRPEKTSTLSTTANVTWFSSRTPTFANGLGIDVHIRTKLVRHWSYIQAVSIRIGNDIIEFHGSSAEFSYQIGERLELHPSR
jgi:hypothetical protein